jgi:hypothetical protein
VTGHDVHPYLTTRVPIMGSWSGCLPIMTTTVDLRKHDKIAGLVMMTTQTSRTVPEADHQRKHAPTPIPTAIVPIMTTQPTPITESDNRRKQ